MRRPVLAAEIVSRTG